MKTIRTLGRIALPFSLLVLAACQTAPTKTESQAQAPAPAQAQTEPPAEAPRAQAQEQGAPVAVFLADTATQTGWTPVNIPSGTLYVNPQPLITRGDLSGVQAGTNKSGDGLLALELNEEGKRKVADMTTKNPNKRLALVVGRTMLAAPGYTTPVTTGYLIFAVGSEANATAAARAIAGVPETDNGTPTGAPGTTTSGQRSTIPAGSTPRLPSAGSQ